MATSDPTAPRSLRRKLFLARKAAEAVEKRGHSTEGDFNFARFEDVLAEASKQLEKRDILVIPRMVEEDLMIGKEGVLGKAVIEYEVIDTKTDESLKVRWARRPDSFGTPREEIAAERLEEARLAAREAMKVLDADESRDLHKRAADLVLEIDNFRALLAERHGS